MLSQLIVGENKCVPYDSSGRGSLEACIWFPRDLMLFLFVDFILYDFAVINCSQEYNSVLSPVCSPSESPNLEVVFGTPNTSVCDIKYDS